MPKKTTASQRFAQIFALFTNGTTQGEREAAERKLDAWLKRHGKTRADIASILIQAAADDGRSAAAAVRPARCCVPSFEDPRFTPAGLAEGIVSMYVTMAEHVRVIFTLWIIFTHVYLRFAIAPRGALVSEEPDSGKTTALDVARHLVFRPNPESFATGAAIADFLDQGPGTVLLDETDHGDRELHRRLHLEPRAQARCDLRHDDPRQAQTHQPACAALAAGVGSFLAPTQKSRTLTLEMEPYTEETKPEREYTSEDDFRDLDAVYSYLRHWAAGARLNPKPAMPPGVIRRHADNVRGLLSLADSCGSEWGRRAREAVTFLLAKEKAERPQITMLRHGLAIFDALELDQIGSTRTKN